MEVTKPYKFIGFGAMDVTKPYKFIGFGATTITKPYKFKGFGAMYVTKPYKIYKVWGQWVSPNLIKFTKIEANECHQTI